MSGFLKNSLIILGLIGVGYFGYYLYVTQSESVIRVDGNQIAANQAVNQSREFLTRLNELRSVQINTDFFRDPRFRSLVDHATPIQPVEVGRDNPFEPVN